MSDVDAALQDIYDRVPTLECRGLCSDSCGPIIVSDRERRLLADRGIPLPSRDDAAQLAARARLGVDIPMCPALGAYGQCTVYESRPLICRLWGAVESMPCEHGCRPARYLTDDEGHALYAETLRIGGEP